jgi:hypothetical protein
MWLAEREADLLPVGYFHVVFTLPSEVADIALHNKAAVYIRTARFPQIKSLDRIDFNAQSSLNKALILERVRYESPELHRAWAIRPR